MGGCGGEKEKGGRRRREKGEGRREKGERRKEKGSGALLPPFSFSLLLVPCLLLVLGS
jgi:hypothetical protein